VHNPRLMIGPMGSFYIVSVHKRTLVPHSRGDIVGCHQPQPRKEHISKKLSCVRSTGAASRGRSCVCRILCIWRCIATPNCIRSQVAIPPLLLDALRNTTPHVDALHNPTAHLNSPLNFLSAKMQARPSFQRSDGSSTL